MFELVSAFGMSEDGGAAGWGVGERGRGGGQHLLSQPQSLCQAEQRRGCSRRIRRIRRICARVGLAVEELGESPEGAELEDEPQLRRRSKVVVNGRRRPNSAVSGYKCRHTWL